MKDREMGTLPNFKDSPTSVLFRQKLGRRAIWLLIYYFIARQLPNSPLPGSSSAGRLRLFCATRIFRSVGTDVTIHSGVSFGSGRRVEIGDYSSLNANCSISNDTVIGSDVMMGPEVLVLSGSHNFNRVDIPMREQGAPDREPVVIGSDVWIGARSILLPGVSIGSHAIVGAGSIVTSNIPEWSIAAGNPARVLSYRK